MDHQLGGFDTKIAFEYQLSELVELYIFLLIVAINMHRIKSMVSQAYIENNELEKIDQQNRSIRQCEKRFYCTLFLLID